MSLRPAVRRTLAALTLVAAARDLGAQVIEVKPPDPAAQAAARQALRRTEARFARRLAKSHGDPVEGARFGEALRGPGDAWLDHPSPALRAAVLAARDPAALALAIPSEDGDVAEPATYETDVLLLALSLPASRPRQAELWAKAAQVVRRLDRPLRIAFLERAYGSLAEIPGLSLVPRTDARKGVKGERPDPFDLASMELDELLGLGLAREAIAAFDALPAELRERLVAAGGGTTVEGYIRPDQRLSLAAARLAAGDPAGARALLARVPTPAWRPADGNLVESPRPDPMAVFRAMLERALAPAGGDDAFPVLAEFAADDLFGPGPAVWGVGVPVYARLAEREGYPELAAYAWRLAPRVAQDEESAAPEPALLPPAAAQEVRRLRAALAEEARLAEAALLADFRAAGEHPRPAVKSARDGSRLDQHPHALLFALDRGGRRGLVVLEHEPFYGELYRIEARDGGLLGVLFGSWIS